MGNNYKPASWYLVSGETLITIQFGLLRLKQRTEGGNASPNEIRLSLKGIIDALPKDPPEAF